jgi:hypothetical protein
MTSINNTNWITSVRTCPPVWNIQKIYNMRFVRSHFVPTSRQGAPSGTGYIFGDVIVEMLLPVSKTNTAAKI